MARAQMDSKAQHKSKGSKQSRRIASGAPDVDWASNNRTTAAGIDRVTATDAKNEFGRVLENVIRGGRVFITKHDATKAVLISIDDFETLSRSAASKLDALSGEFDALLARMQLSGARARMKAAFDATPKQLGRAAVRRARKGG